MKDIRPDRLSQLSWGDQQVVASLETLHQYVTQIAHKAIEWYLNSKRSKQRGAMLLRVGAIIMASLAGILPVLSQLLLKDGVPIIQPAWATVALGLAAAMVALDKFFGFSSGWMRFIKTELRIQHMLEEFQVEWEAEKMLWKNNLPSEAQTQKMIAKARNFLNRVHRLIQDETIEWISEFQSVLKQIEKISRKK
ncbi:MAG: hypothetical protein Kow0042_18090 [Calditrichia bacterium]